MDICCGIETCISYKNLKILFHWQFFLLQFAIFAKLRRKNKIKIKCHEINKQQPQYLKTIDFLWQEIKKRKKNKT